MHRVTSTPLLFASTRFSHRGHGQFCPTTTTTQHHGRSALLFCAVSTSNSHRHFFSAANTQSSSSSAAAPRSADRSFSINKQKKKPTQRQTQQNVVDFADDADEVAAERDLAVVARDSSSSSSSSHSSSDTHQKQRRAAQSFKKAPASEEEDFTDDSEFRNRQTKKSEADVLDDVFNKPPLRRRQQQEEQDSSSLLLQRTIRARHGFPSSSTVTRERIDEVNVTQSLPRSEAKKLMSDPSLEVSSSSPKMMKKEKTMGFSIDPDHEGPMLHPDSVELTEYQRKLLWDARCEEYSVLRRSFMETLESHHDLQNKCLVLSTLHDKLIERRMRLPADMYEDFFLTFVRYGTSSTLMSDVTGSSSSSATTTMGRSLRLSQVQITDYVASSKNTRNTRSVATHVDDFGFGEVVWDAFQYCIDSGTTPTTRILQNVMRCLLFGGVQGGKAVVEERAHRVMLELERNKLPMSTGLFNMYLQVCARVGAMHVAMTAYVHALASHHIPPSGITVTIMLDGFLKNKEYDAALEFVKNTQNVPVDANMLNSVLNVYRFSREPLGAFTAFRATVQRREASGIALMTGRGGRTKNKQDDSISGDRSLFNIDEKTISILLEAWRASFQKEFGTSTTSDDNIFQQQRKQQDLAGDDGDDEEALQLQEEKKITSFRYHAKELKFLMQTSMYHRVKSGEPTLNKFVESQADVVDVAEQLLLSLRVDDDDDDDDDHHHHQVRDREKQMLSAIATMFSKMREALVSEMSRMGMSLRSESQRRRSSKTFVDGDGDDDDELGGGEPARIAEHRQVA